MEIFFKCNEMGKMEVKVKGYKNDITGLEDLSWSISIIVSKMLNQFFEDAPTANKKEVADIILDKSKDTIYRFYKSLIFKYLFCKIRIFSNKFTLE